MTSSSAKWEVRAELPIHYEIEETLDLLSVDNPTLLGSVDRAGTGATQLVLVDTTIDRLYGDRLRAYLEYHRVRYHLMPLPSAEEQKTIDLVLAVASAMNEVKAFRVRNPPIAIGGGVMLDIVGLAASLYRRGIPYIRVPTTLLGLVDVSVAAKTGVNFEGFRNRLGSYSPPLRTLIDRSFLATLPRRQLRNGMGEIFKMALIKDVRLFGLLERYGAALIEGRFQDAAPPGGTAAGGGPPARVGSNVADEVIGRAIQGMVEELQPNLWEKKLERSVDYGHSFSPLLEMRALPELYHGEAVALDCVFSAFLAEHRGFLEPEDVHRVVACARSLGLPVWHPLFCDPDALGEALADTVRHRNGDQNLPVMAAIGSARFLNDVTPAEIEAAAAAMAELAPVGAR
ncbi:sedoheptulose 7-phosphate cyclase [Cryptosporangium aurantiacum]|uniref:2-epi-5-epi-valiolone synthase n=1 Tax=Cryptosporangium aurantiacum TaxID=134849 RepID=A0A1M7R8P3_9ACTN|nr:sedoheptulose 7-phosphate cyclase [Cryptosporangium aurantiacum]SHN42603.1 3-dehydroquinate synthase [Cryptosporangium aurantiacum]